MKGFAILPVLLYICAPALSEPVKRGYDRDQVRTQSIQKLIETEESFDAASTYYRELIQIAESSGDERLHAECLFQVARIYYWQTKFSLSLAETKKGLNIARRLNDYELLAVGYDLLGRLHYLFSPEQAQYYYRKCWQYCEQSDSIGLSVSNFNSYNLIRPDHELSLKDLLSIDIRSLRPVSRAWLGYNIARAMLVAGRIDEALGYLDHARDFLQHHSGASPLNAMYENMLAHILLHKNEIGQAWEHWRKSFDIVRKNKMMLGFMVNYKLASEIAQAEKNDDAALDFYKKSVAVHDSIFNNVPNKYFPDDLVYTMMEYLAEEEMQAKEKRHLLICVCTALCAIAGISLLYYFKSASYRKKTNIALKDMKSRTTNELHSKLKNHVMKIMYGYRAGVNFCLKHTLEISEQSDKSESTGYFGILENYMRKADAFMDNLIDRVEAQPDMKPEPVCFDAKKIIDQIIALDKISFVSKHIIFRSTIDEPVQVFGDKILFSLAMEHLFFKIVKAASKNAVISVSAENEREGYTGFCISDPENKENTVEKEIFAQRIKNIGKEADAARTADWDFNIFAECMIGNRAKIHVEFDSGKGTTYCFGMPNNEYFSVQ